MEEFLNSAVYSVKSSAIRVFNKKAKEKKGCISLTLGEPDFDTPNEIKKEAVRSLEMGDTHYIENNGSRFLRKKIAEFERERNSLDYSEDEIIVTVGATEGIFCALFGILNPGDEVVVPTPAFGLYESVITLCKGEFVPMDTGANDFQISKEMLESKITEKTKAIILNTPNNPTGCILSEESLLNIYDAVKDKNIFVICDDVYSQLVYADNYVSFSQFRDLREKIIVIQSFSKPYAMTGWRMGYMMMDSSIKKYIEKIHQYTVVSTSSFSQKAAEAALSADVSEMVEVYRKRRDYVLKRLSEMNLDFTVPEGGFYVFPSIKKFGLSSSEFCERLIDEALLAVTPGFCFGSDEHIRLTYCYSDENLKEGLDRLQSFIEKLGD